MIGTARRNPRIVLMALSAAAVVATAVALTPGIGAGQTPDTDPPVETQAPGDRTGEGKVGALSPGQIVNSAVTATDLAQQLVGPGVTVNSASVTGDTTQFGTFSGLGAVGFDSGVGISSGNLSEVVGPNVTDSLTTAFGGAGDADLDALVAPNTTLDAAVLTIELVPAGSQITFDYVFSSDEYNEFVNSGFDDVFGFFANGVNCATVGGQRVSINTINNGNPFGGGGPNAALYRNNDPDDPGPPTLDTEMDGLTTVLQCVATVNPGVPNTLKLAIADTSDPAYDSAVFLRTGSLTSANVVVVEPSFTG